MAFTLPIIDPCCVTDCTESTGIQIPGPKGEKGDTGTGAAGAAGKNAYTVLTVAFTMPAEQANGQITVANTGWMVVGQIIYIQGLGYFRVVTVDTSTLATVKNLEDLATEAYLINSAVGTIAAVGSRVGPGGEQGPTGAAFSGISQSDGDEPPADPTAASIRYPLTVGPWRRWDIATQTWG